MRNFLETKGFKTRLVVSIGIVAAFLPAYYFLDGLILKILLSLGFAIAIAEMASIGYESKFFPSGGDLALASFLGVGLIVSLFATSSITRELLGTAIVASAATDVGAYMIGKAVGSHHLPKNISPNKTYEGCFGGLLVGMIVAMLWSRNVGFIWMAPVASLGDLLESVFKRRFGVKDSNDFLIESDYGIVRFVEGLLGGKNGHGGYFDRLDSLSLVLFAQVIILTLFP